MVVFPYLVAARNGLACDREYRRKGRAALLPREQGMRDLDHSACSWRLCVTWLNLILTRHPRGIDRAAARPLHSDVR